jgi:ubiquitin-protein ligase
MLNPKIRTKRLQAEQDRVRALHERGGLFAIDAALGEPPDRYVFRFTCRGIASVFGEEPIYSEEHQVAVVLTETYPTTAPLMEWLTPIFHPNIRSDGQGVCIGSWYPAKTLDQLVLMLGEMIQYRNYASHDPLNLEASLWAMSRKELFPVDRRLMLEPHLRTPLAQPSASDNEPEITLF